MSNADTGDAPPQSPHSAAAPGPSSRSRSHSPGEPAAKSVDHARPAAAGSNDAQKTVARPRVVQARPTPASSSDDNSTGNSGPPNPCRLVSLSEAQAITGGAISKLTEAPLGPTCIYSSRGRSAGITLVVEPESFTEVTRRMTARKDLVIRGHRSVCGRLGTQMLFLRLGQSKLLNVTAPCGIAQRFAAVAVSRLPA